MSHEHVSYLDLKGLQKRFAIQDAATLAALHESGQYIGGALVSQFEEEFARYCGVQHCIGTANGLDALTISLLADKALGVLPENAHILLPAQTYIATFLSIVHAGMTPVPVDVESLLLTSKVIKPHIGTIDGIVCVDIYGKMVDVEVYAFAKANSLPIYCDTAQSHGATNLHGNRSGSLARASAFSFYPTKNLGALGDAGAITTNDEALANVCRKIANYGRESRFVNDIMGMNSRLDPLQAGFLSTRLKALDADNELRKTLAAVYMKNIENAKVTLMNSQFIEENAVHVFPVIVNNRDTFVSYLASHGIETSCHYKIPPHKQVALKQFNNFTFPITERIHNTEVSLPCNPLLSVSTVERICQIINAY